MEARHVAPLVAMLASATACSSSNNVLLGHVQATAAGHRVVVEDCYRLKVDMPQIRSASDWSFAPCRDAVVVVRANELTVNGHSYGTIEPGAAVLIDHGAVSVGRKP